MTVFPLSGMSSVVLGEIEGGGSLYSVSHTRIFKNLLRILSRSGTPSKWGARCSSVVIAFAHGAMGRRIGPSRGGPIELFLVRASAPRLV